MADDIGAMEEKQCSFCWVLFTKESMATSSVESTSMDKVYDCCVRHLKSIMDNETFFKLPEKKLTQEIAVEPLFKLHNLCVICLESAKKLTEINARLEAIEKEIADFANSFKSSALALRKKNSKRRTGSILCLESDGKKTSQRSKRKRVASEDILSTTTTDNAPKNLNEFIQIKSETSNYEYEPEEITDYFTIEDELNQQLESIEQTDPLSIDSQSVNVPSVADDTNTNIANVLQGEISSTEMHFQPQNSLYEKESSKDKIGAGDLEPISIQSTNHVPVETSHSIHSYVDCGFEAQHYRVPRSNFPEFPSMGPFQQPVPNLNYSDIIDRGTASATFTQNGNETMNRSGNSIVKNGPHPILTCNICGKVLPDEQSLYLHLEHYHNIIPFRQDGNTLNTFTPNIFPVGPPDTLPNGYIKCNFCLAIFTSSRLLFFHQKVCYPEYLQNKRQQKLNANTLTCELCSLSFINMTDLKFHGCIVHDIPLHCDICQMPFNDPNKLETHKLTHSGTAFCYLCQKHFPTSEQLNIHVEKTHLLTSVPFTNSYSNSPCNFFNDATVVTTGQIVKERRQTSMVNENASCSLRPMKPFKCLVCSAAFDNMTDLTSHRITHSSVLPNPSYVCEICGTGFTTVMDRVAHAKTHSDQHLEDEVIEIYQCTHCDMSFTTNLELTAHKVVHAVQKRYFCHMCSQVFQSEDELNIHKEQYGHTRPFPPNNIAHGGGDSLPREAEIPISKKANLYHRPTDSCGLQKERKKYNCKTCGVYFQNAVDLDAHIKIDSKESSDDLFRFKCCICCEKFETKLLIIQHQITHSQKADVFCSVCCLIHHRSGTEALDCQSPSARRSCYKCCMVFTKNTNAKNHDKLCVKLTHLRKGLKQFDSNIQAGSIKTMPYKCSLCDKVFKYHITYKSHLKTHRRIKATTGFDNLRQLGN